MSEPTFGLDASLRIPIATRDTATIAQKVGRVLKEVRGRDGTIKAVLVAPYVRPERSTSIPLWSHPDAAKFYDKLHPGTQVWVRVDYKGYREAYKKFGGSIPAGYFLDHVQNVRAAKIGLGKDAWIRLQPVTRVVNTNAGHHAGMEGMENRYLSGLTKTELDNLASRAVVYADPGDITKMLNVRPGTQVLAGVAEIQDLYFTSPEWSKRQAAAILRQGTLRRGLPSDSTPLSSHPAGGMRGVDNPGTSGKGSARAPAAQGTTSNRSFGRLARSSGRVFLNALGGLSFLGGILDVVDYKAMALGFLSNQEYAPIVVATRKMNARARSELYDYQHGFRSDLDQTLGLESISEAEGRTIQKNLVRAEVRVALLKYQATVLLQQFHERRDAARMALKSKAIIGVLQNRSLDVLATKEMLTKAISNLDSADQAYTDLRFDLAQDYKRIGLFAGAKSWPDRKHLRRIRIQVAKEMWARGDLVLAIRGALEKQFPYLRQVKKEGPSFRFFWLALISMPHVARHGG